MTFLSRGVVLLKKLVGNRTRGTPVEIRPRTQDGEGDYAAGTGHEAATLTIKDVVEACGLPQPVIMQLVPRTWTSAGWMYTGSQRDEAVEVARELHASKSAMACINFRRWSR